MYRKILLAAMIMVLAVPVFAQNADDGKLSLGDFPPSLNVEFVRRTPVNLMEGVGEKVIIVEFWATWCAPCKYSIPHLTELQKKYGKDGLVIVGISDESIEDVRQFLNKVGAEMDYTVAVDRGGDTKKRYYDAFGVDGIPQAFVIDVNGRLAWQGHPNSAFLDRIIPILLEDIPNDEEKPTDDD